jgi:anti-sigma factor RsiW
VSIEELSCQELVELVTDYVEGALPAADRARFEAHLPDCDGCTAYLEQMRFTIDAVGELCDDHVAEPVRNELLRAFRDWKAQR